jgi:hypothetical protein
VKTNGPIRASPLLMNMNLNLKDKKSLAVIIPSFDGFIYIIDGRFSIIKLLKIKRL